MRSVRGQRLVAVADMLAEAQHREGPARQQVHRHIGDFTLFWTGVYPEVVEGLRRGRLKKRAHRLSATRQAHLLDREHHPRRKGNTHPPTSSSGSVSSSISASTAWAKSAANGNTPATPMRRFIGLIQFCQLVVFYLNMCPAFLANS